MSFIRKIVEVLWIRLCFLTLKALLDRVLPVLDLAPQHFGLVAVVAPANRDCASGMTWMGEVLTF